jgi:uncharacterized membrane protein
MTTFLILRVLHILLAASWFGSVVVMTFFVVPAIRDAKAGGGAVMAAVQKRGFPMVMQAVAGLTVLTGIYLYWHFTSGFDPVVSASLAGRVFGAGGLAGILAIVIGASVVGRTMMKIADAMSKASGMPVGPERTAVVESVAPLQARADFFSKIVLLLMVIAIVTMSIGHYVG